MNVLHSFEAVPVAMASSSTAAVAGGAAGEMLCICTCLALPLFVSQGMDDIEVIESFRTPAAEPTEPTVAGDLPAAAAAAAADAERLIRSGSEFVYGILSLISDVELLLLLLQVRVVVVGR